MDKDTLHALLKSGEIASSCLNEGARMVKVGTPYVDVCDEVERRIINKGGGIAFPAQVSLNQVAAHFCPTDDDGLVFKEGDLVKLDIGVHADGHIADTAVTINLGGHDELVKASRTALDNALKMMEVGVGLGEIGKTIQETISSFGFSPIRNLSGHGLDRFVVHTKPTIPNFDTGDRATLQEDVVFACEPFATPGKGSIFESSNASVFSLVQKRQVRSPYAREILQTIEAYQGLPFTTRWLTRKHGKGKALFGLKELIKSGIVLEYPPLPEVTGGLVSQAEHSVLFDGKRKVVYTKAQD